MWLPGRACDTVSRPKASSKEETMKSPMRKLSLSKETLRCLDVRSRDTIRPDTSCIDSCYLVSCDGGCGISEGAAAG
jgi:hypothetical protein